MTQAIHFASDRKENWLQAFTPFPELFSKAFFFTVGKSQEIVVISSDAC